MGRPWVKGVVALAAVQEYVADKLPQAPSRLDHSGLAARVVLGAVSGAILARRSPDRPPIWIASEPASVTHQAMCAGVAAAAALTTTYAGVRWRGWAAPRIGAVGGAGIEDAWVVALAYAGARR